MTLSTAMLMLAAVVGVSIVSLASAPVPVAAQRFYYRNFRDRSYLTLNGDARRDRDCVQLTANTESRGSMWYDRPTRLDYNSGFLTAFNFHSAPFDGAVNASMDWTSPRAIVHPTGSSAVSGDGFAFVVTADGAGRDALGNGGAELGYGGLRHSLVVEFDTHNDNDERDPSSNHVSIHVSGDIAATVRAGTGNGPAVAVPVDHDRPVNAFEGDNTWISGPHIAELRTGSSSTVQIGYQLNTLKVFLNDLIHPILTVTLSPPAPAASPAPSTTGGAAPAPIAALSNTYYIGFTSAAQPQSTGAVRLCDWYFERTFPNHIHDREPCDEGFFGESCALDSSLAESECLRATRRGCAYCMNHVRDCSWCPSLRQCLSTNAAILGASSALVDTGGDQSRGVTSMSVSTVNSHGRHRTRRHPKSCTIHSLVSDTSQCSAYDASLSWVLYLFVVVLGLLLTLIGTLCLSTPPTAANCITLSVTFFGSALFAALSAALCFYVLIEITLSPFVATLFGIFFLIVALFMAWRSVSFFFNYGMEHRSGEFNGEWIHLIVLTVFVGLVFASGVLCFLVDKDFAHNLSTHTKVPLYILLAVSMCFALCFCIFDALFHVLPIDYQLLPKPYLQNLFAVRLMGVACLILGIYFGSLFGGLEAEDIARSHIEIGLERENDYGYPLASLLGGVVGFVIQFARLQAPQPIEMRFINSDGGDSL